MAIRFYTALFYGFDNFSPHAVELDGAIYPTSEHAYQAQKFNAAEYKEMIRLARSPLLAKQLANGSLKSVIRGGWDADKLAAMECVLRAKLTQHGEVKQLLLLSSDEQLVENSPVDYFWGEGQDGTGRNELGKLWMRLRAELKGLVP